MAEITRSCTRCAMEFSYEYAGGRYRKFCSTRCARAGESVRVSTLKEARKPPRPRCKHCDSEMARRATSVFCGAIECQQAKRDALAAARDAALPPKPRCKNCDIELAQRRTEWTYCDAPACRTAKHHARQDSLPRCSVGTCDYPVIARGLCGSHYAVEWRLENLERSRANAKRRRALKRGVKVEDFTSAEVFERDGWVCGLCDEPIPREVEWPDRLSPSIDHVIPLARGGEHSMLNVQAAHLGCNSRKQDRVAVAATV